MVSISGKWTFSGSNWPQSSYWTMDIWSLSSLYQVFNVCFWCARGMKILWTFSVLIVFFYNGIVSWRLFSQVMAVSRNNICKNGLESVSRGGAIIYYAAVFLYFWVFSTPVVSLVFGSYLYICINWLHLHFDEAFSSLRIANYKSFTRFHISSDGNLEVFTLAVDKVRNYFMWSKI